MPKSKDQKKGVLTPAEIELAEGLGKCLAERKLLEVAIQRARRLQSDLTEKINALGFDRAVKVTSEARRIEVDHLRSVGSK